MEKKKVSDILKEFGLSDDTILSIAVTRTLGDGIDILKAEIGNKWLMDTLLAMKTVKKLKEEFD